MRLFAGIEFNKKIKDGIARIQEVLNAYCVGGRWKRKDNFHLTLKFLGEVEPAKITAVNSALEESVKGVPSFFLKIGPPGLFRGGGVLWLGLDGQTECLVRLKKQMEDSFFEKGFPREPRKFSPHVTIAQDVLTNCPVNDLKSAVSTIDIPTVRVEEVILFKSEQAAGKRLYTPIHRLSLAGHGGRPGKGRSTS